MGVTASKHVEKSWPLSSSIEATLSPPCTVEPLLAHTSGWIKILGSRGYEVGRVGLSCVLQFYKGCMVPTCCEIYEVNFSGTIKKQYEFSTSQPRTTAHYWSIRVSLLKCIPRIHTYSWQMLNASSSEGSSKMNGAPIACTVAVQATYTEHRVSRCLETSRT